MELLRWAHRLDADSYTLSVTAGGSTELLTVNTSDYDYWFVGSGDAQDILPRVRSAMLLHSAISAASVGMNAAFLVSFTLNTAATIDGAGTFPLEVIGFPSTQTSSMLPSGSPFEPAGIWRGRPASTDSEDQYIQVGGTAVAMSGSARTSFMAEKVERSLGWTLVPRGRAYTRYAVGAAPYGAFEYAWRSSLGRGYPVQLFALETDLTAVGTYNVRRQEYPISRSSAYPYRFDITLHLGRVA